MYPVPLSTARQAIHHPLQITTSPVDDVRDHTFTDHPWLAADPDPGPRQERADLDVWGTPAGQQARQAPSLGDRLTRVSPARHITGCSASRKPRSLLN